MKLIKTKQVGVYYRVSDSNSNNKCFYIAYQANGKTQQEKIGWQSEGYNLTMAIEIRNERIQQARHGEFMPKIVSLENACRHYLSSLNGKPSLSGIKMQLEHFQKYIGAWRHIRDINSQMIIEYIKTLSNGVSKKNKPFAGQTITHYFNSVRQMFNYCIDTSFFIGKSPINRQVSKNLPKFNNTVINYFVDNEDKLVFAALDKYKDISLANFFRFAFFSGMRESEIFKLEWRDIDIEKGYIILRNAKSGKNEFIGLNKALIAVVEEQRKLIPSHVIYVFPNRFMARRTNIQKQFATLKKAAGITRPFRFHDLRHNFASLLIDGGAGLYDVQNALTHKDPKTTQKYAHLRNERKQRISNITVDIVKPDFLFCKE